MLYSNTRTLLRSEPNQKRSITASLIQGVYVSERDHQQNRVDHNALALIWWKIFDFELIQLLVDNDVESTIFGAIFEYKPRDNRNENDDIPPQNRPPKYVIAFRDIVAQVSPENVWLTGHSLGAAIALQIGKTMARQGISGIL
ncbi:GDSL esterase/lipase At4g10955-like [Silene latifolia]|uniref:GDSL esterase/lipase At4g10955-like n=1 Tax=Silene latifolia TaxID=37657 RepID=UPI003D77E0D2